jgi:hypothetical protein
MVRCSWEQPLASRRTGGDSGPAATPRKATLPRTDAD